jgi:hypothetical protein
MNESVASTTRQRALGASLAGATMLARDATTELLDRASSYSYRVPPATLTVDTVVTDQAPSREDLPLDQITFRRLQTAAEIARISHLREEIQLPASTLADPVFRTREKKEMKSGLSALSSAAAS